VDFWDNVYDYKMTCIKEKVLSEPLVDIVYVQNICTDMVPLHFIDLYTVKKDEVDFTSKVNLPVLRNDYCHALVAFFEVEFSKCHRRTGFSTGPHCPVTHWKQTVFYLEEDLMVTKGTAIETSISVKRNDRIYGDLDITIEVNYNGPHQKLLQKREYLMR